MSALLVSIVIPTFEGVMSCARAVQSALAQEPPPREVIVCDDGSRDETPGVMRACENREPRLHYIRLDQNTGTAQSPAIEESPSREVSGLRSWTTTTATGEAVP